MQKQHKYFSRVIAVITALMFSFNTVLPVSAQAQSIVLPVAGTMVGASETFTPLLLKGMTLHADNPLAFDFIVDAGDETSGEELLQKESERLVKYFLAAMTTPSGDFWVNLSPIEKDRVITEELGKTVLGRDMLAQDYILKQLTSTLMYPESDLGKKFWDKVYERAGEKFGASEIPTDVFNKVWIVPESAQIFEKGHSVFVTGGRLKVMLEEDYVLQAESDKRQVISTEQDQENNAGHVTPNAGVKDIIRAVILPELEREVNEGRNFAPLRQIYYSLILAKWYKETVKSGILSSNYVDQKRVSGIDDVASSTKDEIYQRYLEAYKTGVFNYIKEDYDAAKGEIVPRHYFSGGISDKNIKLGRSDQASLVGRGFEFSLVLNDPSVAKSVEEDSAMLIDGYDGEMDIGILSDKAINPIKKKKSLDKDILDDMEVVLNHLGRGDENYHVYVVPADKDFGAALVPEYQGQQAIILTETFYQKMKANPKGLRQRTFIHLFTSGNRLDKVRAEYAYARDVLGVTNDLLRVDTFDQLITRIRSQIIALEQAEQAGSLENALKTMGHKTIKVTRPESKDLAYEASEILANSSEESLYRIAINAMNGDSNPKARVRLHKNARSLEGDEELKVGFFAFSGHPMTLAHFITNMLQGMAEAKTDAMIVSVTKGDFRKTDLKATFDIRNQMVVDFIHDATADMVRVMTLPDGADDGLNGEEKIEHLVDFNQAAKHLTVFYLAGGDHNLVFVRSRENNVVFQKLTSGAKGNLKDFLYYVQRGGKNYQKLLSLLIKDKDTRTENLEDNRHVDMITQLVNAEDPVALVKEGQELPQLDVIAKLLLLEKYFETKYPGRYPGEKKVKLVFLNTERPGDEKKESIRQELNFPSVLNPGLKADISSTNLRLALLKMILEKEIDVQKLYAIPKDILVMLLKKNEKMRNYLFSLIRFKSAFALSADVERFFPLNPKAVKEAENQLREKLIDDLGSKVGLKGAQVILRESKLFVDLDKNKEKGEKAELGTLIIKSPEDKVILSMKFHVVNGMDDEARALNTVRLVSYRVDQKYPGVLAYAHQFLANLNHDPNDYLSSNGNGDHAMLQDADVQAAISAPGGIDMNDIQLDGAGQGTAIEFDSAMLESLKEKGITGFVPVISNFRAVSNLSTVIGK